MVESLWRRREEDNYEKTMKSRIYIFTPSGERKQKLLGHHRTPRHNEDDITVTLNEKTKSMTYKRLVLILKISNRKKLHPYMKRPSTNAMMKEHLSETKPIRLIATHETQCTTQST